MPNLAVEKPFKVKFLESGDTGGDKDEDLGLCEVEPVFGWIHGPWGETGVLCC